MQYIKQEMQCFITFPNTEKRAGNTTHSGFFLDEIRVSKFDEIRGFSTEMEK